MDNEPWMPWDDIKQPQAPRKLLVIPIRIGSSGITNTFTYKNVKLNFLIDIRHGGDIFSLDQWYGEGTGLYPNTVGLNERGGLKRDPVDENGGILLPGVKEDGTPNDIYTNNEDGNDTVLWLSEQSTPCVVRF